MRSLVKVMNLVSQFKSDENGASLIEYTVLLALLLVAVIAVIAGVGKWIRTGWASLSTSILTPPKNVTCGAALRCFQRQSSAAKPVRDKLRAIPSKGK